MDMIVARRSSKLGDAVNEKYEYLVQWSGFRLHTWEDEDVIMSRRPDLIKKFMKVDPKCKHNSCKRFDRNLADIGWKKTPFGGIPDEGRLIGSPVKNLYTVSATTLGIPLEKLRVFNSQPRFDESLPPSTDIPAPPKDTPPSRSNAKTVKPTSGMKRSGLHSAKQSSRPKPVAKTLKATKTVKSKAYHRSTARKESSRAPRTRVVDRDCKTKQPSPKAESGKSPQPSTELRSKQRARADVRMKQPVKHSKKQAEGRWAPGTRMSKLFPLQGVFHGQVVGCEVEEGTNLLLYLIKYDDGDTEDLYEKELAPLVVKAEQMKAGLGGGKKASRKRMHPGEGDIVEVEAELARKRSRLKDLDKLWPIWLKELKKKEDMVDETRTILESKKNVLTNHTKECLRRVLEMREKALYDTDKRWEADVALSRQLREEIKNLKIQLRQQKKKKARLR
ncbi:hypothetical protein AAMO2058_001287700 [Amorphochlora amoebiformis]